VNRSLGKEPEKTEKPDKNKKKRKQKWPPAPPPGGYPRKAELECG